MSKDSTSENRSSAAGSLQEYPYATPDPELEEPTSTLRAENSSPSGDGEHDPVGTSSTSTAGKKEPTSESRTARGRSTSPATDETHEGDASKGASRTPKGAKKTASDPAPARSGPRRVRLTLSRVDPRSVMKLSFLVAIAFGLATVVAVALVWNVLEVTGMWDSIDSLATDLAGGEDSLPFMEYFEFSKMISYATVVAVVDIVIITALGTLLAFLYNIVATLLGGLKVTFTDE